MPPSASSSSQAPFSVRLSPEERARLEREAAGLSLGVYIRSRLFGADATPPPRSRGKFPVKDHKALAQALGLLGQSRIASNLNQLARAAHLGSLPVDGSVETDLTEAVHAVAEIRALLMVALGLSEAAP
ncbi:plasmid mobilization relaxosome protein MobC [Brevundimonas sp. LPMIX5]|nr:plasmid mobilization relaxosome protein MobC [Brevundimonas sp. LPMIX5]